MTPNCPFCGIPMQRICEAPTYDAWGCEECLAYLNRGRGSVNERKETTEAVREREKT